VTLASIAASLLVTPAAQAVKISPVGDAIKLTGGKVTVILNSSEKITCEAWDTTGTIPGTGTLPVSLTAPTLGTSETPCTFDWVENLIPTKLKEATAEELTATSKTSASLGKVEIILQMKSFPACTMKLMGKTTGVWANGKNGTPVAEASTLTMTKAGALGFYPLNPKQCNLLGNYIFATELTVTFSVTDTTHPEKAVLLE
jgi:hypothetical protein